MAESMRPADFRAVMDRYFQVATEVLIARDAIVDKFVGDEVIGIFVPPWPVSCTPPGPSMPAVRFWQRPGTGRPTRGYRSAPG